VKITRAVLPQHLVLFGRRDKTMAEHQSLITQLATIRAVEIPSMF